MLILRKKSKVLKFKKKIIFIFKETKNIHRIIKHSVVFIKLLQDKNSFAFTDI